MDVAMRFRDATTLRQGHPESVGMSRQRLRHVGELAQNWLDQNDIQCLVALVARHGQIVFYESFGRQLPERESPAAGLDSIFPMASITKVFTATAVMALVEDGRVGLNRRVREYIPEFV